MIDKAFGWLAHAWESASYRVWLLFGGRRTERGFETLSLTTLENRRSINDIRSELRLLRERVSDLEFESRPLTAESTARKVEEISKRLSGFEKSLEDFAP